MHNVLNTTAVRGTGADIVLGMVPFARELLRMGAEVVMVANSLPAINDITTPELRALLQDISEVDPIIKVGLHLTPALSLDVLLLDQSRVTGVIAAMSHVSLTRALTQYNMNLHGGRRHGWQRSRPSRPMAGASPPTLACAGAWPHPPAWLTRPGAPHLPAKHPHPPAQNARSQTQSEPSFDVILVGVRAAPCWWCLY